jgi:methylated-DNA-[protein]-cysteine S-methyltransferase
MKSYSILKTTVGNLILVANEAALIGIYFEGFDHIPAERKKWTLDPRHPVLQKAEKQLTEYFHGKRSEFSIPLGFKGTPFQERVWKQIARIPFGKTISYSDLARKAGSPKAIRAAGTNTGKNPLAIVIPCHRVLTISGTIGGFAGGLKWKRHLLGIEKIELAK